LFVAVRQKELVSGQRKTNAVSLVSPAWAVMHNAKCVMPNAKAATLSREASLAAVKPPLKGAKRRHKAEKRPLNAPKGLLNPVILPYLRICVSFTALRRRQADFAQSCLQFYGKRGKSKNEK
jgi:hypothetical protein